MFVMTKSHITGRRRGLIFLVLWLFVTILIAGPFVELIPPGGVLWPYYCGVLALIPLGAFFYARHYHTLASAVICYGLLGGFVLGLPIFDDERALMFGRLEAQTVALRIGLCTLLMAAICVGVFAITTTGKNVGDSGGKARTS